MKKIDPIPGRYVIIQTSFPSNIKTRLASGRLGITPIALAGHMFGIWAYAMENAPDGKLELPPEHLAMAAYFDPSRAEEFVDTLVNTGFLEKRENGYVIHDWNEYSGRLFLKVEAKREKDRLRLASKRKAEKEKKMSQKSRQIEEIEETEEIEKIEEGEENSTESNNLENIGILSLVPNGCERGSDVPARKARARETEYPKDFEKLWKDYPRKERKRESFKAYAKALETHDAATLDGAVRAYVERCRNEAREPRYVPMLFRVLADIDEYPAAVPDPDEGLTPKEIFERAYRAAFPALFEEESAARKLTPKEEYERAYRMAFSEFLDETPADGSPGEEDGATVFDAEFMPPTHEEDGETE